MKILIVSPAFAPLSTVGAARMTSLAKYLREKHEVSVLTYSLSYYNNQWHLDNNYSAENSASLMSN